LHICDKELIAGIIALEFARLSACSWLNKLSNVKNVWRSFLIQNWCSWWLIHHFDFTVVLIPGYCNPADKWTRW